MKDHGPQIPIKPTRATRLQAATSKHSPGALGKLTHSELGSHVSGQNKAVSLEHQRRLNTWHRETALTEERLNRRQNVTYDVYRRLEDERKHVLRVAARLRAEEGDTFLPDIHSSAEEQQRPSSGDRTSPIHLPKITENSEVSNGTPKKGNSTNRSSTHPQMARYHSRLEEGDRDTPTKGYIQYKRDRIGNVVEADILYRRRKFPKIQEKNQALYDRLIRRESQHKQHQLDKFVDLSKTISDLDSWSPLTIIRALRDLDKPASAKPGLRAQGSLGSLDYMVRAFASRRDEQLLAGLDPNSEEALRLCKYLRPKGGDHLGDGGETTGP